MKTVFEYAGREYKIAIGEDCRVTFFYRGEIAAGFLPFVRLDTVSESAHGDGGTLFAETKDVEREGAARVEKLGEGRFLFTSSSSLWEKKTMLLECDEEGFSFTPTVYGRGAAGRAAYFTRAGRDEDGGECDYGSQFEFCEYFVPYPTDHPHKYSSESFRSFYELMIPPPYVFPCRMEAIADGRFGFGLIAKPGEYNFIHFDYNYVHAGHKHSGFCLSTGFEGHTKVDGEFTLPAIRVFFGKDDLDVIAKWAEYHFENGLCPRPDRGEIPRWWYGPIVCGWNEQDALQEKGVQQKDMATQQIYTRIADMIGEYGVRPTMLIIDDKWQRTYGDCLPDGDKWQDMRAFTDEMHRRGLHTLLWFKMWGGEGLPDDEKMEGGGMPYRTVTLDYGPYADPTNEKYRAHLKEILYKLLSPDEGCMDCDGFKLDYSLMMPYGKSAKSASGAYGAQLTYELHKLIYETAKQIKPDCLINASPAHPYYAAYCDMARLHDYGWDRRNESEEMARRAAIFRATMPGVLIDCDSANYGCAQDAMRYYRAQPQIGVPDIYQFTSDDVYSLDEGDWDVIRRSFNGYADEMDRLHGKDGSAR